MACNSSDARFCEVNRILEGAIDAAPEERDRFIADACGSDAALEHSVHRLLKLSAGIVDFLDVPPVPDEPAIRPGDLLLDRFRIVSGLGHGGMGSVWLADDPQRGPVALKTLRHDLRADPVSLARFRAEIEIARAVSHPNVCAIFDLFITDHPTAPAFFTMQFCGGETLAERIARGPVPLEESTEIARGIAAGLDALHAQAIVHRDLKPSNIILRSLPDGSLVPVITDFGLAQAECVLELPASRILGSPDYMAPEQFRGNTVKPAADIFSLGVILFEMLAGARPYPKEDIFPAALRRVADDAPPLSSLRAGTPEALDDVLAQTLSRDPSARFPSAEALVRALEPISRPNAVSPARHLRPESDRLPSRSPDPAAIEWRRRHARVCRRAPAHACLPMLSKRVRST